MRALLVCFAAVCLHAADYDLIVRNARVVDGTGNPWFRAGAAVGNLARSSADRGIIREGFWADLVLFEPARIQDKAKYENPHQDSEGLDLVVVNGQPVVEDVKLTSLRPERILRGAGYAGGQGQ